MVSPLSLLANDASFLNICDTRASCCTFNTLDFFPTHPQPPSSPSHLHGIADSLLIAGIGMATLLLKTHKNTTLKIHIPSALYVLNLPCNLISPQWLIQALTVTGHQASFHAFPNGCLFIYDQHIVSLCYHPMSNLPIFDIHQPSPSPLSDVNSPLPPDNHSLLYGYEASTPSIFHTSPSEYANLTSTQHALYDWHVCLGHLNFPAIQAMARKGLLGPRDLSRCQPPLCHECLFGKAKCHSITSSCTIGDQPLHPGEMCCVDQMVAGCKGLPYTMHGS